MSIALYFVMTRMMPAEVQEIPGGREQIRKSLAELGPMKASEKKLLAISLTLLLFRATEGVLHSFDTSSTTLAAVALMFLPGIGIMTWKEAQPRIPWGTCSASASASERRCCRPKAPHGSPTLRSSNSASRTEPRCSFWRC
jgi:di/tricarboxylate transporter